MPAKRQRPAEPSEDPSQRPRKNLRLTTNPLSRRNPADRLSSLSDELLIRVLSFLPLPNLLKTALVSHHFCRLASDSQLWRALYYSRFVLPRALRIPGFRDGTKRQTTRLHYSARRAVWADGGVGRRGGLVDMGSAARGNGPMVDWKRQYKLRHNWSRGKATVEELDVGDVTASKRTLAKVVEGIAITADVVSGLRAWDLKTKDLIAHIGLLDASNAATDPTCLAVDDQRLSEQHLDICIGFQDGSFGVWRVDISRKSMELCYRHAKSSNGALIEVAYRHPHILTATESVLVSLYNFKKGLSSRRHTKEKETSNSSASKLNLGYESDEVSETASDGDVEGKTPSISLPPPILLTSLKSPTSRAPLALVIRSMAGAVVASIAYTFSTRNGWSIGIQELHVNPPRPQNSDVETTTRLAYTLPVTSGPDYLDSVSTPPATGPSGSNTRRRPQASNDGPTTLCYTHPYLLATLPDNTLILHVCTSNATTLSLSPGIRLWGHTSGISDAEITARGKAVSVSSRGEEIRVWELEGRAGGKSIEIRPNAGLDEAQSDVPAPAPQSWSDEAWRDKRNWVGFDDEMVIVLKETRDGRETLMVYDFT